MSVSGSDNSCVGGFKTLVSVKVLAWGYEQENEQQASWVLLFKYNACKDIGLAVNREN